MTTITRVGFCPKCFKEERPKTLGIFIAFGSTCDNFKSLVALNCGRKGFTPHTYQLERVIGDVVYYQKICGMVGCGAYLAKYQGDSYVYLHDELWEYDYTSIANWNALVSFKDTGFNI